MKAAELAAKLLRYPDAPVIDSAGREVTEAHFIRPTSDDDETEYPPAILLGARG